MGETPMPPGGLLDSHYRTLLSTPLLIQLPDNLQRRNRVLK